MIELLVVLAIITILTSAAVVGLPGILGAGSLTAAINDVSGILQQARSYAMANNTYVFVGLEEIDPNTNSPTIGTGKLVICVAASEDGTDNTVESGTSNLVAINKVKVINNIHLADLSGQVTGNMARTAADTKLFTTAGSSSQTTPSTAAFYWPITATSAGSAQYQFSGTTGMVIQFAPDGSAFFQQTAGFTAAESVVPLMELGLQQTHGTTPDPTTNFHFAAIQIQGVTGSLQVYRP